MRYSPFFTPFASSLVFALSQQPTWSAPVSIRQVATAGAAAPGGGSFSGIDFSGPLSAATGEVFFTDSNTGLVVGQPGSLARLNVTASTIANLTLGVGESITTNGGITVLSSPAAGQYLVQTKITTSPA